MGDDPTHDEFLRACGVGDATRLVVEGPGRAGDPPVTPGRPFAVIGRGPGADLVLDHPDVSRRHAYLQFVDGRPFVVDLASRGGISWGDERRHEGWISPGEAVRIGPFLLRAEPDGPGDAGGPAPTSRAFRLPGAAELALDLPGDGAARRIWQASRVLVLIGGAEACRVRLPGPGVSAHHAALVRTPGGAWVVDLNGRGGVAVNGEPAHAARLGDGDEIAVGPHRLGVRLGVHALPARVVPARATASAGIDDPLMAAVIGEFGRMQESMADQFRQALLTMFHHFSEMHRDQMALIREELGQLHELARRDAPRASLPGPSPAGQRTPERPPAPEPSGPAPRPEARAAGLDLPRPIPRDGDPDQLEVHRVLFERLVSLQEDRQGRWQKLIGSMFGKPTDGAGS